MFGETRSNRRTVRRRLPSFTATTSPSKMARSTGMSNAAAIPEKRFVQSSPVRVRIVTLLCVPKTLNPIIVVMKSAKDGA